jgi:RNA polymerase sigma factor (sigma-70 family)
MEDPFLLKLQANENAAWNEAYDQLYRIGQASIALKGPQFSEDRNDIIIKVITYVSTGVVKKKFNDWNHVKNAFRKTLSERTNDFFRKAKRSKEDFYDPQDLPEPDRNALDDQPPVLSADEMIILFESLDPPLRQQIFFWIYVEGLTAQQVTDRHGHNRNNVLSHLARGYKRLREKLPNR